MVGTQEARRTPSDEKSRPLLLRDRGADPSAGLAPRRLAALVGGSGLLLLVLFLAAAYAMDAESHAGRVARGVRLAGADVGGQQPGEVGATLEDLTRRLDEAVVAIELPTGGKITSTGHDMGLQLDAAASRSKVLRAGKGDSLPGRFFGWARSRFFGVHRRVPLVLSTNEDSIGRAVALETGVESAPPVEPSIGVDDGGRLVARPGRTGTGVDLRRLANDLVAAGSRGMPIEVTARDGPVDPRFTEADAAALATRAERLAATPLSLRAGAALGQLAPPQLRTLFVARPTDSRLELAVDEDAAAAAASEVLADAGTASKDATFTVQTDGSVAIAPAVTGTGCCDPTAGGLVGRALLGDRSGRPLELPLTSTPPRISDEIARSLGIKERTATFSTRYPPGQPRVENIHRISDLIRGQVILPGESFSVNDFIGPRTEEKGFVVDHVIEDGVFTEAVGGGISQFATTLFNAAWFGGLDFDEYQSHSIYISRYPYGREATLNYRHPDLKLRNTTPHGVLLWPTYSDNSLTVSLFSTTYASGEVTGQTKVPIGSCTRVTTTRLRTYPDGRRSEDHTYATYHKAEGQPCTASAPIPTIPCPIDERPCPPAPPATSAAPARSTPTTKAPPSPPSTVPPSPPASAAPTTKAAASP